MNSNIIDFEWPEDSNFIKVNLKHTDDPAIYYVKRKVNREVYVDLLQQNDPKREYYGHFYPKIWEEESDEITEEEEQEILNHPYIIACLKWLEKRESETKNVKEELYEVIDNLDSYIKLRLSEDNPHKDRLISERLSMIKRRIAKLYEDNFFKREHLSKRVEE